MDLRWVSLTNAVSQHFWVWVGLMNTQRVILTKWSIDIKGDQGPLSVKFQNTLAEVDGLYRFMSGEHNLDFLFGLRYTDQET